MSNAFYKRITELRQLYPGFQFIPLSQCSAGMFAYNGASIISDLKQRADQNSSPYEFTLVAFKNNNTYKKEGPLLTTIWNQDAPYNALCPKNTLAGCVAIAMAQIMRYHKHPSGYNWNNMPDNTATYDTQSLIYEIGKAVKMDYGQNGSSSDINKAFIALASKYNYSPSKGDFNHEKVSKEIFTYKRPVYMRGGSSQILLWDYDGHAWVCDGADKKEYETSYFVEYLRGSAPNYYMYNNDYYSHNNHGSCGYGTLHFHMNWGWGGTNNGWFLFSSANSGNGDYKYGRQDMYIIPNK